MRYPNVTWRIILYGYLFTTELRHTCSLLRNILLCMCFIDFEKAFDMVSHKKLWATMIQIGFAPHIVKRDKWMVRCSAPGLYTLPISVQYHDLCELLMRIALNADDIVLIASTREELHELVNRVHNAAVSVGMRLNVKKRETMGVSDDKSRITVKGGSDSLREVHSFKYTLVQGSMLKRRVSRK